MRRRFTVVVTTLVALGACDGDGGSDGSTPVDTGRATPTTAATATTGPIGPTPTDEPKGSDMTVFPEGDIEPGLQPFIDRAIADLSAQLAVDESAITVVSAVLVTWPDASYGCPVPGMQYAQVLEDGSVIELRVGDLVYRYHSGGNRGPFRCDLPLNPVPARA